MLSQHNAGIFYHLNKKRSSFNSNVIKNNENIKENDNINNVTRNVIIEDQEYSICARNILKDNINTKVNAIVSQYSGHTMIGYHPNNTSKKNQDCLLTIEDKATNSFLFVCLDGHGNSGEKVSQFTKNEIELNLFKHKLFDSNPQDAIKEVLCNLEKDLFNEEKKYGDYSGTTLCMALIRNKKLIVTNIGDSRIVLGKKIAPPPSEVVIGSSSISNDDHSNSKSMSSSNNSYSENSSSSGDDECDYEKQSIMTGSIGDESLDDCEEPEMDSFADHVSNNGKGHHKRHCWRPVSSSSSSLVSGSDNLAHRSSNNNKQCYIYVAENLSIDHKPDLLEEYNRILAAGGRIFAIRYSDGVVGPPRVWLSHSNIPGLAMSRSIGDFIVHTVGVVSTPDIYEIELDQVVDNLIIIATDGLWDQVSNAEAVNIASSFIEAQYAVAALIELARSRWLQNEKSIDDITVCVIYLNQDSML